MTYKIIIAGSRNFNDYNLLDKICKKLITNNKMIEIVSGGAYGADKLGERYAKSNKLKVKVFKADWDRFGKSAGYRRNVKMAEYADALIAFWDGKSKGTFHMINIAKEKGIGVTVIDF